MLPKLFVFAFFSSKALAFLDYAKPSDKLQFTTSAGVVNESIPLVLECEFVPSAHPDFASLLSLKLSKRISSSDKFVDLVSVTKKGIKDLDDDFQGTASGQIHQGDTTSVLKIEFIRPTLQEKGEYRCQAAGLDDDDMIVGSESSLRIGLAPKDEIVACSEKNLKAPTSVAEAKAAIINCGAFEGDWFEMFREVTQRRLSTDENIYGVSGVRKDSSFYIFSSDMLNFYEGTAVCKDSLGYIVEINSEEEFLFLENALNVLIETVSKRKPFNYLYTGTHAPGPDEDFRFETHPEAQVYLGHWLPEEPSKNHPERNWLLLRVTDAPNSKKRLAMLDGELTDDGKQHKILDAAYLCEVSSSV